MIYEYIIPGIDVVSILVVGYNRSTAVQQKVQNGYSYGHTGKNSCWPLAPLFLSLSLSRCGKKQVQLVVGQQ